MGKLMMRFLYSFLGCAWTSIASAAEYDINAMGRECTEKIGIINPFSCLDGELIPITVNGKPIAPGDNPEKCDRPSFLLGSYESWCKPNARVGRLPNLDAAGRPDDDVQNLFICRRYTLEESPDNTFFEDIAIIQHRKSTGDTCFFQHEPPDGPGGKRIDTARIPPPSEPAADTPAGKPTAHDFWLAPADTAKIDCRACHGTGPFVRSPYIMQVKKDGVTIVYPISSDPQHNYRFVGKPFESWNPPMYIAPANNRCVTCHVIGTGDPAWRFSWYSAGGKTPHISEMYASYPYSHWMPSGVAVGGVPEKEWRLLYTDSVQQVIDCSDNPKMMKNPPDPYPPEKSDPACNRQYFGPIE